MAGKKKVIAAPSMALLPGKKKHKMTPPPKVAKAAKPVKAKKAKGY